MLPVNIHLVVGILLTQTWQTQHVNVKQNEVRPIPNMLFGNPKHMRTQFFNHVRENNLLEQNLINLFKVYKSSI